jgi:hypothetical protein
MAPPLFGVYGNPFHDEKRDHYELDIPISFND